MARIYITFPLHRDTEESLELAENKILKIGYATIFYEPRIGQQQHWQQDGNAMYQAMENSIRNFKPNIIIIGNNRIPETLLDLWRTTMDEIDQQRAIAPMIIRRGIELGGIPVEKANQHGIHLRNIPAINSPYVSRHMLRHLNLSNSLPGQKIAILGAGDIGLPIIKAAARNQLQINIVSDSTLSNTERRTQKIASIRNYLQKNELNDADVHYPESVDNAIASADYIAISVPWWLKKRQRHNIDMIDIDALKQLSPKAVIVSCSNPRIFTEQALHWMNRETSTQRLGKVRIDTGHSYAAEVYERYNCTALDVKAGEAFYNKDCLIRLDRALLSAVYRHAKLSTDDILSRIPKPTDDMDIESYVTNIQHFFNAGKKTPQESRIAIDTKPEQLIAAAQ